MATPHPVSLAVCPLRMIRINDGEPAPCSAYGTGFLWEVDNKTFLLTNWHNLTGVNPDTGKLLGDFIPTHIQVGVKFILSIENKNKIVGTKQLELPLYDLEGIPLWLEHPDGCQIDCVALEITASVSSLSLAQVLNKCDFEWRLPPSVGTDVFVVGYPHGLSGDAFTPIWKRGSIASEPSFNHQGMPIFLIDTATRKGMSGSPVIVRHNGLFDPGNEGGIGVSADGIVGTIENFCGIYSGRIGDDELGVQLGRVWKNRNIKEIFSAMKRGQIHLM